MRPYSSRQNLDKFFSRLQARESKMISRRKLILGMAGLGAVGTGLALTPAYKLQVAAQTLLGSTPLGDQTDVALATAEPWAEKLIDAAQSQIGQTIRYDPSYVGLDFPMGDIPRDRGVCTDVIIRAYRDAFEIDLQKLVHNDMKSAFGNYPKIWGLKRPDRNIDHRRVPNLERYFKRQNAALEVSNNPQAYQPGDLVTQRLPGNLPHIMIVSNRISSDGKTPLVVHNIGAGTRLENRLFEFRINGHFRFKPENV